MKEDTLTIDWDFCLKIVLLVVFVYFLYIVQDLVIWLVFALVLSILFNFIIDFLEKKKIPRVLAAFVIYFGLFALLGFFFYRTAPEFLREIKQFSANLPFYLEKISPYLEKIGIKALSEKGSLFPLLENNLEQAGQGAVSALLAVFGGIQATLFIFFLAFFMSLERNLLERFLANFSPKKYKDYLFSLLPRVKRKVSGWFLSRVIGVLFVGALTYAVLFVFNVKYGFILALLFGVFDFIPIAGPIVGGAIVVAVVMMSSVGKSLFVLASLVIIQQLENNFLFPLLFKKLIGIPPALVLFALALGAELWGFLGAILAIPLAGVIFELIKDYVVIRRKQSEIEQKDREAETEIY